MSTPSDREPVLGVDTVYSRPLHVIPTEPIGGTETYLNEGHALAATGIRKRLLVPAGDGEQLALYGDSFCRVSPVLSGDPQITDVFRTQGFTPPNMAEHHTRVQICEPVVFTATATVSGLAAAVRHACMQDEATTISLRDGVQALVSSTILASDENIVRKDQTPGRYTELVPLDAEPTVAHIVVDRLNHETTLVGSITSIPPRAEYAGTVTFGPGRYSERGLILDLVGYTITVDKATVKRTGSSVIGLVVNSSSDNVRVYSQQAQSELPQITPRLNVVGE